MKDFLLTYGCPALIIAAVIVALWSIVLAWPLLTFAIGLETGLLVSRGKK